MTWNPHLQNKNLILKCLALARDKQVLNTAHTFLEHNSCLEEFRNIEKDADEDDREDVQEDSLFDAVGVGEVTVGVGVAHSTVSRKHK